MNNWALIALLVVGVVLIVGCTTGSQVSGDQELTTTQAQGAMNEFESTMIDENSTVEIGSLI